MLKIEIIKPDIDDISCLWDEIVETYCDSSLYQTVTYASTMVNGKGEVECVLFRDNGGHIAAAAVIRIYRVLTLWPMAAYLYRGPMIHPEYGDRRVELYAQIYDLLWQEYVEKRRMYLRIFPCYAKENETSNLRSDTKQIHSWVTAVNTNRTYFLDLNKDEGVLRNEMHKQWRYNLRKSERAGVTIWDHSDISGFDKFALLYGEMHGRKQFRKNVSLSLFQNIQARLPEKMKLGVALAYYQNEMAGGIIWSSIGQVGLPIFSATSPSGRKLLAGYLLRWHALCDMKNRGCSILDQGGVDKISNPGGYEYKSRMGGQEYVFSGVWHCVPSTIMKIILKALMGLKNGAR